MIRCFTRYADVDHSTQVEGTLVEYCSASKANHNTCILGLFDYSWDLLVSGLFLAGDNKLT